MIQGITIRFIMILSTSMFILTLLFTIFLNYVAGTSIMGESTSPIWSPKFTSLSYSAGASRTRPPTAASSEAKSIVKPGEASQPFSINSNAPYVYLTIALESHAPPSASLIAYVHNASATPATSTAKAVVGTPLDTVSRRDFKFLIDARDAALSPSSSITILAGDQVWRNALSLTITMPKSSSIKSSKWTWEVKRHTFSGESRRPFALIPLVFSGVTCLPLIMLLLWWRHSQVLDRVHIDAGGIPFLASLAAMLLLFLTYWFGLKFFVAINAGTIIFIVMIVTGLHALRRRSLHNDLKIKAA